MAVLNLTNVPVELLERIEAMAAAEALSVEVKIVRILEAAIGRNGTTPGGKSATFLQDIQRCRLPADPDGPTVVEMLREDRNR